jgi:F-box protein 9
MDDFKRLAISTPADEELERFRREWQEDLKRKVPAEQNVPRESGSISPQASPKASFQSLANKPTNVVDPQQHALQLYTQAVGHEQAGQLNEALILYRKAFRYDGEYLPVGR